jgi:hypothetical protein
MLIFEYARLGQIHGMAIPCDGRSHEFEDIQGRWGRTGRRINMNTLCLCVEMMAVDAGLHQVTDNAA